MTFLKITFKKFQEHEPKKSCKDYCFRFSHTAPIFSEISSQKPIRNWKNIEICYI